MIKATIYNDINNAASWFVIPAQAGIQWTTKLLIMNICLLDSRLRGNDERGMNVCLLDSCLRGNDERGAIYDVTYN